MYGLVVYITIDFRSLPFITIFFVCLFSTTFTIAVPSVDLLQSVVALEDQDGH